MGCGQCSFGSFEKYQISSKINSKGLWFYRKSHFATKTDRNFSDVVPTILGVFKNNVSHHKNQNGYPSGLPKKKMHESPATQRHGLERRGNRFPDVFTVI
jgi:hypothetical protein